MNIFFLNKYEAVFEFAVENDVSNIVVSLQKLILGLALKWQLAVQ